MIDARPRHASTTLLARGIGSLLVLTLAATFALSACSSAPNDKPQNPTAKPAPIEIDLCEGSKPVWRQYSGPLKSARCEQEMFSTMAEIARDLDVKCDFCHVPNPDRRDFDFPSMTPNKETALWMSHTFMSALKRRDGQEMTCASCHVDRDGKPAVHFLGQPRNQEYVVEWMTTVMTNRFTLEDGSKLKCKHCHVSVWGTSGFQAEVINRTEQVPNKSPATAEPIEPTPTPEGEPRPDDSPKTTEPPPNG